jgi:hypothetical protein
VRAKTTEILCIPQSWCSRSDDDWFPGERPVIVLVLRVRFRRPKSHVVINATVPSLQHLLRPSSTRRYVVVVVCCRLGDLGGVALRSGLGRGVAPGSTMMHSCCFFFYRCNQTPNQQPRARSSQRGCQGRSRPVANFGRLPVSFPPQSKPPTNTERTKRVEKSGAKVAPISTAANASSGFCLFPFPLRASSGRGKEGFKKGKREKQGRWVASRPNKKPTTPGIPTTTNQSL